MLSTEIRYVSVPKTVPSFLVRTSTSDTWTRKVSTTTTTRTNNESDDEDEDTNENSSDRTTKSSKQKETDNDTQSTIIEEQVNNISEAATKSQLSYKNDDTTTSTKNQVEIIPQATTTTTNTTTARTKLSTQSSISTKPHDNNTGKYPLFVDSSKLRIGDMYSGMWWQSVTNVIKINTTKITWLEAATFISISNFIQLRQQKITMTYDMLDFGVEHLSTYIRYLRFDQKLAQKKQEYTYVLQSLQNYSNRTIYDSPFFYNHNDGNTETILKDHDDGTIIPEAIRRTIAIIPFGLKSASLRWVNDPSYQLRYESLFGTIVSIWQLGVGRVVIVGGNTTTENEVVTTLITNLQTMISESQQNNPTVPSVELQFIDVINSTLLPTEAIRGLQYALVGNYTSDEEIEKWLGTTNRSKWQYVYFSEPDLILNTRPRIIPYIAKELQRGQTIMAHRFQLVQHGSDYPNFIDPQLIMPAVGRFANVTSVSSLRRNDQCIWENYNNDRIALKNKTCQMLWNRCGFDMNRKFNHYKTIADVEKAYQMYKVFNFMRLVDGTGFTTIAGTEGRNICRIILNNNNNNYNNNNEDTVVTDATTSETLSTSVR
jgi:hypothetical protein